MRLHLGRAVLGIAALALASPSFAKDEAEATVVCKDGSISKAGRGACRGHGGVDKAASKKAVGGAAEAAAEKKAKKGKDAAEKGAARAATEGDEKAAATTVVCKDGSTSKGGRGACRGHGGVDKGATARGGGAAGAAAAPRAAPPSSGTAAPPSPAPAAAPPVATPPARAAAPAAPAQRAPKAADDKGPPTARCNDGTFSYAQHHTGACSRHGGVAEWLDKK